MQVCNKIDGASLMEYPFTGLIPTQAINVEFELSIKVVGRRVCCKSFAIILLESSVRFRLVGKDRMSN